MALLDNLGTPAVTPLRAFDDYGATRKAIFDNVVASFGKKYPLTNQRYSLGVENLKYDSDKPFTIADQKRAILAGSNLERRLVGDWVLKDLAGKELDRKKATTIAHVPYMTDRGTFIHGGSEYSICLHPDTMIWTEQGQIKIRDIVNKDMDIKVWSYDFASKEFVLKPIVRKFKNKVIGGIGHIEFDSAGVYYACDRKTHPPTTLWGTSTHRVYNKDGSKQELRYASKAAMVIKKLSYTQEQTLYGGLLGDSHIDPSGTLRLVHGLDQEEYFFFKKHIFGALGETANGIYDNSRCRVSKSGGVTVSHSAMIKTAFKSNIEFCKARRLCYPNDKKTITLDWLSRVDEMGLAVWFMDDGSSFRQYPANTAGAVLHTQGFTESECDIAIDWFMGRWSLKCFKSRNHSAYVGRNIGWTLNFCADEAERFFDIIAPYVHPSLFYKLLKRPITWSCFGCGCEIVPGAKWCTNCIVKNAATFGKKFSSEKRSRTIFGDVASVRRIYCSGEKFIVKTGCERWESRMKVAGNKVPDMLSDNKQTLSLMDVPCVYKEKTGKQWEKTSTVYNLEVADTHNYFANSVLTSNCNQARLRPGIYSRHRESGELESHFNIKPGTGRSFRIYMEPATGIFRMGVGQSTLKLYPLLRAMGLQDRDIAPHWGKDILQANIEADDPRAVARAFAQFLDTRTSKEDAAAVKEAAGDNQGLALRKVFETSELDEDVTTSTMGHAFKNAGPDAILGATGRLLKLSKGEGDTDDRDSLEYQTFHTPEDFFGERIEKDAGQVGRKLLWKATLHGNLSKVPPAALSRQVRSVILNAGLAQALEESNMLEPYDQAHRVIRLGEGGISSVDAIPDESRNVNPSQFGIIDPIRSPESNKAGIDTRLVKGTYKGPNNTVLFKVNNVRTGQPEFISAQQAAKLNIAFPGELADGAKKVRVMSKSRNINYVGRDEVDYELPSALNMFAAASNLTPMIGGIKGGRLSMGSRFANQALPLKDAEAPLVRSDADDLGIKMGAVKAGIAGIVTSVGKDHVEIRGIDGQKHRRELYDNFPLNRRSFLHNESLVKAGDQVSPSTVVAKSNYTDKNGDAALGKNLRTAYLMWGGKNYEDAIIISESAAKKLSSEHMYQNVFEPETNDRADRRAFLSVFPTKYNDAQLRALDSAGVVKPGTVVKYGDPLLLATRKASHDAVHRGKEALFTDASMVWKHDNDGVVTDVSETKDGGWNITIKSYAPMKDADKLGAKYGDKGVVGKILPDSQMPHTADGEPVEVVLNPLGVLSRGNVSQVYEALLGKIARKTGQPYKLPHFSKTSLSDFVKAELQKHGVSDTEDLVNPDNGSKIPKVLIGDRYFYKLHHTVESKGKARDVAAYTIDEIPASGSSTGSKRIAGMETAALLSHGVPSVIRDAKTIRGQRNDEYWRQFRAGFTPASPKVPFIYQKFISSLQSAGVNVQKNGNKLHLFGMTGAQINDLSQNEITVPDTVKGDNLEPIEGGLFDPKLTGSHGGTKWSFIRLAEPMPNPVMEDPIRRLLGLTKKKYEAVLSGAEDLQGERGGAGIKNLLAKINVPAKIQALEDVIKNGAKSKRDDAVKALGFLKSMQAEGVAPVDFMTDKVPVLPPAFRPIVKLDKMMLNADPNFLYKDLMHVNSVLGKLGSQLSGAGSAEERLRVYNAYKAVTGLGDPVNAKTQEKNVKGVLGHIFGSSPKTGTFQRRMIGMPVDVVGRSVVTPSPDLGMDQVGIPEDLAWTVYRPFAIRRMVRAGMPATEAARAVADKKDVARRALIEEMGSRPVMVNRAPTLHKFNFMAFKPILVAGKTIQVSPVVTKGFNMDFDGNCILGSSKITLDITKESGILRELRADEPVREKLEKEIAMKFGAEAKLKVSGAGLVSVEIYIKDVPYLPESQTLDKNGAKVYSVPPGMSVMSIDIETGQITSEPITGFTVEDNVEVAKVVTRGGLEVVASTNESLCVYDHVNEGLVKTTPAGSIGKLVPVVTKQPVYGDIGDYEFGWMLGAFVSDGFFCGDSAVFGYAKSCDLHRARFAAAACAYEGRNVKYSTHREPGSGDEYKLGYSVKDHFYKADKLCSLFKQCYTEKVNDTDRAALRKTLPDISGYSEEALYGLLAGLLDGDGAVSINNRKGHKAQTLVNFNTSSRALRDSVIALCAMLGVKAGYSTYYPKEGRLQTHEAYIVTLSIPDVHDIVGRLNLCDEKKMEILKQLGEQVEVRNDRDIVPIPGRLLSAAISLSKECGNESIHSSCVTLKSLRKPNFYATRQAAKNILSFLRTSGVDCTAWETLVTAKHIRWDIISETTPAGRETVYDLMVPSTKVFAVNGGLVVYDTVNFHVPVSDDAVQEALTKMLPSRNLFSGRDFKVHYTPSQEFLYGAWLASRKSNKPARLFATREDALRAYKKGELRVDDPIQIGK